MIIKEKSNKATTRNISKISYVPIAVFLIIGVLSAAYLVANIKDIRDKAFELGFKAINPESIASALKRFPTAYLKSKFDMSSTNDPKLYFDIKFKDFTKLQKKRDEAIDKKLIVQKDGDYVPAEIRYNNNTFKVKLRIKGDNIDHLLGDKWSFRLKIKGEKALFGMRTFSVQNPFVRGFYGQHLIDETRRMYGLIAPRRVIVDVFINGKNIGLMEVEEHFSKELLENNSRKESVIVRFNEDDSWIYGEIFDYTNTMVKSFQSKKIKKSKTLNNHEKIAVGLLRGFSDGEIEASSVFSPDKMGMFLAISRIWGAQHSVRWGNLRFYYNPYVGKLEPIGYDDNFHERTQYNSYFKDKFFVNILKDELINKEYKKALSRLIEDIESKKLIQSLKTIEKNYSFPLYKEFYLLEPYKYVDLVKRANWIKKEILKQDIIVSDYSVTKKAHIYLIKRDDSDLYDLQFSSALPIELKVLSVKHSDPLKQNELNNFFKKYFPLSLNPKYNNQSKFYKIIPNINKGLVKNAKFVVSPVGEKYFSLEQPILYSKAITSAIIQNDNDNKKLINDGVIKINENTKTVTFNSGNWKISNTIQLFDYEKIIFEPGVKLNFENKAGIISNVPFYIDAQEDNVAFIGNGDSGWVYIFNAKNSSIINGLSLSNVGEVRFKDIVLTGAFSIYNSETIINGLKITKSNSEDALNIISSKFNIQNCKIAQTNSDAIDVDFSNGSIDQCQFNNIGILGGGDGIDTSGSDILIKNINFNLVSDKAISIGERSSATIINASINKSSIGIAAKDGSDVKIIDGVISNAGYSALMAYIKKKEYKGSVIDVSNLNVIGTKNYIADKDSKLTINGIEVINSEINTKQLYETIMKSGTK